MCQHSHTEERGRTNEPADPGADRVNGAEVARRGAVGGRRGCVVAHQHPLPLCNPPNHDPSCNNFKTEISCNLTLQGSGEFIPNCVHQA
jgi:hypothetical protein